MKRGFTLLEMLVASLLLGMLVSLLTTMFSQSSIAWAAGVATVADMDRTRQDIAAVQAASDVLLDKEGDVVRSVFQDMTTRQFSRNGRAVERMDSGNSKVSEVKSRFDTPSSWAPIGVNSVGGVGETGRVGMGDGNAYVVGVTSLGPDGKKDTWDDITTWPTDF